MRACRTVAGKEHMAITPDQLEALRPHLQRFAQLQLRDTALAEDVVADTLLAVLEHPERFAGNASLKTYVIGILKHKIVDACLLYTSPSPRDAY